MEEECLANNVFYSMEQYRKVLNKLHKNYDANQEKQMRTDFQYQYQMSVLRFNKGFVINLTQQQKTKLDNYYELLIVHNSEPKSLNLKYPQLR